MRITIWYTQDSKERATMRFEQIVTDYTFLNKEVIQQIKTKERTSVLFLNGDLVEMTPISISRRGQKASISYYPLEEINNELSYAIVNSCTTAKPHFGIILY